MKVITRSSKKTHLQAFNFLKRPPGIPTHHLWCYILAVNLRCHQVAPKKFLKMKVAQGHLKATTCSHLGRCVVSRKFVASTPTLPKPSLNKSKKVPMVFCGACQYIYIYKYIHIIYHYDTFLFMYNIYILLYIYVNITLS